MKDKTIRPGDLVMVIGETPCCKNTSYSGHISKVIDVAFEKSFCGHCFEPRSGIRAKLASGIRGDVCRLKKIDPPSTGEYDRVPVRMKEPT